MTRKQRYEAFLDSWLKCKACACGIMCGFHARAISRLLKPSRSELISYTKKEPTVQPLDVDYDEQCN